LVHHVAPGHSAKSKALRATIRNQFEKGRSVTDPIQIETLKASAVRALSNYLVFESGSQDPSLRRAMTQYHDTSVQKAKDSAIKSSDLNNNERKQ
jgi:Complex 1 protein (LYR family)